jgi:hypothetical protein
VRLKRAMDADKPIPTEFKKDRGKTAHDLEMADDKTIVARTHIDDEYEDAKY